MRHKLDKDTRELADELARLKVLADLDRHVVEVLAETGRVVHLPASWALMTESQPADSCYVLLEGDAEVRHAGERIASLGAGALVGEAALVEHRTRNASVITTGPVRALRLGFDELNQLFTQHHSLEQAFRRAWVERSAEV
jgi:CRP-like cAMP-binding protein